MSGFMSGKGAAPSVNNCRNSVTVFESEIIMHKSHPLVFSKKLRAVRWAQAIVTLVSSPKARIKPMAVALHGTRCGALLGFTRLEWRFPTSGFCTTALSQCTDCPCLAAPPSMSQHPWHAMLWWRKLEMRSANSSVWGTRRPTSLSIQGLCIVFLLNHTSRRGRYKTKLPIYCRTESCCTNSLFNGNLLALGAVLNQWLVSIP